MVKQAAASALITLRIDEAAEEILMQLVCIGDSDRIFRDLAWVEGLDLKDVCRRVLMSGSLSEKGQLELGRLCGQYDEIRKKEPSLATERCVSGRASPIGAARRVEPAEPGRAFGWWIAPGAQNGGLRYRIDRDEFVDVISVARHDGETWFLVDGPGTPEELWMKESDLRYVHE